MSQSEWRPEIDGLRAIAVLLVVLYHCDALIPGGYTGVDVFFVISGFLVTRIIVRQIDAGAFSLIEFWERRIRRIVPAITVVVASVLFAGWVTMLPDELIQLGEAGVAQPLMVANFYSWMDAGYFGAPRETQPLLHTWSLAVEEQFYVICPVIILIIARVRRGWLGPILCCAWIVSFIGCEYGSRNHPVATYLLLPTRAWELLTGSLLALAPVNLSSRSTLRKSVAMAGLLCLAGSASLLTEASSFPGWRALFPVLGTAGMIWGTDGHNHFVQRMLALAPLRLVGLISYSLYLWHWPILAFTQLRYGDLSPMQSSLAVLVSVGLAALSYWFVERPFRQQSLLRSRRSIFLGGFFSLAGLLAAATFFIHSKGGLSRFPAATSFCPPDVSGPDQIEIGQAVRLDDLPSLGVEPESLSRLDFLVWSDSHGPPLMEQIDIAAKAHGSSGKAMIFNGLPPVPSVTRPLFRSHHETLERHEEVVELLVNERPRSLILICRWGLYLGEDARDPGSRILASMSRTVGSVNTSQEIVEHNSLVIEEGLEQLTEVCRDADIHLWIMMQVPETAESSPHRNLLRYQLGLTSFLRDQRRSRAWHLRQQERAQLLWKKYAGLPHVDCVDPAPDFWNAQGESVNYRNGQACYFDSNHLTTFGAEALQPLFDRLISQISKGSAE